MTNLAVQMVTTHEAFVDAWSADDLDTRLLWQLLGQLEADEVLVRLPEWLAELKAGFVVGAPPTAVTGRIERETDQAVLLADSAAARPLMKLSHRIQELEGNDGGRDRDGWLDDRPAEHRQSFENRDDVPTLADE